MVAMFLSLATLAGSGDLALAQEEAAAAATEEVVDLGVGYAFDNAVLFMCAVLVFFMQAGFAMVEAGFNSSKNAVNILFKNSMDICVGVLLFFFIGFGIMYPAHYGVDVEESKYFAFGGAGLENCDDILDGTFGKEVGWLFQAVFAATAATIVSGAVAGRMKVASYLIYSAVLTGLIYPISGMWKWGGGWLAQMGFQDFAGSAVVHGVGGFAGLAGAIILGPRIGRFVNGKSVPMPGHSLPIAALGVFILWFGWYGFNPGSMLAFQGTESIDGTMHCAMTTTLAAGSGGLVATLLSWFLFKRPDLSMGLNGILGGLVGITACCDCMSLVQSALIIGPVAGALVVAGVMMLDKLRIDDPVGAWPVHGLCGIWGCLAIGILPNGYNGTDTNFMTQLIGTLSICGFAFVSMFILFSIMKAIGILRVSEAEEQKGLDISEHGMQAYGGAAAMA
ncbi:MAG: ammonium transporter [Pirellulales bacterium]|nr:ammonium transporter [Pirellulales bacterium]